ncbi:hypothetical protein BOQ60_25355, partial [Chryseobacterium sp. CH1]
NPNVITSSTTWNNNKAKIIYGNLTINPSVTLDINQSWRATTCNFISVVQDAEFFIQTPGNPNVITSSTTWNNNKAKIIYGNLTINPSVTLDI